ncbi:UNVERIFIED_CONTAM: hypothetical protein GTU68_030777 [Idotea baltica]|nr:hypothetical protein [Idotea baltica]
MEQRDDVIEYINRTLGVSSIKDYCPNGLQIAGCEQIEHLVSGVTASQRFLDAAITAGADAVLVHHGYFWRGEPPELTGMKLARIRTILDADLSLLAYHLPLDVHPELGNNAQLGKLFGFEVEGRVAAGGTDGLLFYGRLYEPLENSAFIDHVSRKLGRSVTAVGRSERLIKRVAWCSGGAQRFLPQAACLGVDAFISGEISEQTTHEARENEVLYVAGGHHATERLGVQALGEKLSEQLQLTHRFIDVENPA